MPSGELPAIQVANTWMMEVSDAALVAGFDDPLVFERFVRRHLPIVYRYVVRRLGAQDADEVVNDVFLTAFRRRDAYRRGCEDARPWLLGIASNHIRSRRWAEVRALRRIAATTGDRAEATERDDTADPRLATALAAMRPEQREVLFLAAVGELTTAQIAEALGLPEGTVKTRLHRARARARSAIDVDSPAPTNGEATVER